MSHEPSLNPGVTVVYGSPGTGKSVFLAGVIASEAIHTSVLALDVTGDLQRYAAEHGDGHSRIVIRSADALFTMRRALAPRNNVVFYLQPGSDGDDSLLALFLSELHNGHFGAYVCDETEWLFPQGRSDTKTERACLTARNTKHAVYLAAKRSTRVPAALRSCTMRMVCFRLNSDADVHACSELAPARLFRRVQSLPDGKALYFDGASAIPSELTIVDSYDEPPWL